MVHMPQQSQLSVATFGVNVTLEWTRQLLDGHSDIVAGVNGRTKGGGGWREGERRGG